MLNIKLRKFSGANNVAEKIIKFSNKNEKQVQNSSKDWPYKRQFSRVQQLGLRGHLQSLGNKRTVKEEIEYGKPPKLPKNGKE